MSARNTISSPVPWYLRHLGTITWFDVILLLSLLLCNSLALSIGIHDVRGFAQRAGLVSTINIIPLSFGGQINIILGRFSLGLRVCSAIVQYLAGIFFFESLLHMIVTSISQMPDFRRQTNAAALSGGIVLLLLFLFRLIRRRFYVSFLILQLLLRAACVAALYLHNPTRLLQPPAVYLAIAVFIQMIILSIRVGLTLYRSLGYKKPLCRASVRTIFFKTPNGDNIPLTDAVHVHIRVPRAWKHRAGQYIYLRMPGVSRTSFAQAHPYYIVWSYRKGNDDFLVLVVERKRGFTKQLCSHRSTERDGTMELAALIEGPYGGELGLGAYGTVLLFATGIGIAGQLPYVSKLLDKCGTSDARTKRISLYWQVESEECRNFLNRTHYEKGDYIQHGERIDMTYEAMDVDKIIQAEVKLRKGQLAVLDDETQVAIRQSVASMKEEVISLKELDFRPDRSSKSKADRGTA